MVRRTSGSLMFNQKNEQKKMKKFWNLMLAALVIIGAAACTENYEGVDVAESLSFYAEIGDDTRAYVEKDGEQWKTTFEGNETLYVNDFAFTNTTEEPGKFTCTAVGVSKLAGANVTITTDGNHHSLQGKAAFNATATVENFGAETVKLQALTSFFRFTYNGEGEVKLTLSEPLFRTEEGTAVNEITVSGNGEQFVAFWPNGAEVKLTFSANGETKEVSKAFAAGMVYNLGDRSPVYKVYVLPQPKSSISKWAKFNLYTWVEAGVANTWPGDEITSNTEVVNGYTYYVYQYPSDFNGKTVNAIVNNKVGDSGDQTADIKLGVLNTDYYLVVNSLSEVKVSTTAPAAGSVEEAKVVEDPKPQTVSLYLKTTWGWSNWALYAWGGTGSWDDFNKWPGKTCYTATIDGVSYKAWDIPASCVGQTGTQIIVTGKENNQTKQSVDFPVTLEAGKDVFITITSWNGSVNKANLGFTTCPYTE